MPDEEMVKKTIADYYNQIIEMVPELKKVPRAQAEKIIMEVVQHGFRAMKKGLQEDPFTVFNFRGDYNIKEVYANNEKSYKYKRKKFWIEARERFYEIADLDETRLYPEEHPIIEEQQGDQQDMARSEERTTDTGG